VFINFEMRDYSDARRSLRACYGGVDIDVLMRMYTHAIEEKFCFLTIHVDQRAINKGFKEELNSKDFEVVVESDCTVEIMSTAHEHKRPLKTRKTEAARKVQRLATEKGHLQVEMEVLQEEYDALQEEVETLKEENATLKRKLQPFLSE